MDDINVWLEAVAGGEPAAAEKFFQLVYAELRQLAAAKMAGERPDHTLQPTALVHEAWLRLGGDRNNQWQGRGHFFGAAAEAMRRILVDQARRKRAGRRGGGQTHLDVASLEIAADGMDNEKLLAVNEALEKLAAVHPAEAELVKLRYFVGLTLEEIAESQATSLASVKRSWTFARAWLHREMQP
jgi:RNA polymerase sigma factor (TIGR02999 family)